MARPRRNRGFLNRLPEREIALRHKQWIGLLQPEGLVVSATALKDAGVAVDDNVIAIQRKLRALTGGDDTFVPLDFARFAVEVLDWDPRDLVSPDSLGPDDSLSVTLREFPTEVLTPSFAVVDPPDYKRGPYQLLVVEVPRPAGAADNHLDLSRQDREWTASHQLRLERLLSETAGSVSLGLLYDGHQLRLVYAPRGETSGHLTFPITLMREASGRVLLGAMLMLLGRIRLFQEAKAQHLLTLCQVSREYQNTVSQDLAEQVLDALSALLHGFTSDELAIQAAHQRPFSAAFARDPEAVYGGLLTAVMRLVFLLYAEERGLMPDDEVYLRHYSVRGLYEKLREDRGNHRDTMHQRHGAWARLCVLFRMVHDGVLSGRFALPRREGELFAWDRYPFLEGRLPGLASQRGAVERLPLISDGIVLEVLEKLMVLRGERLSYRALDVEQIGSVYQGMMGFRVVRALGPTLGLGKDGVPVRLDELLAVDGPKRKGWIEERIKPAKVGRAATAITAAKTLSELESALAPIRSRLTPTRVEAQGYYLEPTDERRRSGTHYTPRALTGPIVAKTLEPLLADLSTSPGHRDGVPKPEKILDLKVCDPAMGSAAFLVETVRQLGEKLLESWQKHGFPKNLEKGEDVLIQAQRWVAERCIYGVDKNAFAVSLGKLSLWLGTLAKDKPFTFVDDSIRHGDTLVGLDENQLGALTWEPNAVATQPWVKERIQKVFGWRERIVELLGQDGGDDYHNKVLWQQRAEADVRVVKVVGDATVAAFFEGQNDRERKAAAYEVREQTQGWLNSGDLESVPPELDDRAESLRHHDQPISPFHWVLEFPEVFWRHNPGFDAFVGNPPFAGKNTIADGNRAGFTDWLKAIHPGSHGNADLVAHFFRRAYVLLRERGTFGLIATNTIAQGDTRASGLTWVRQQGGVIYAARKRVRWPGLAAVIVSVVHVRKAATAALFELDGRRVDRITAYLVPGGTDSTPLTLEANSGLSFQGPIPLGMGFVFDDSDSRGNANPVSLMRELVLEDPRNAERVFPYIGGGEILSDPSLAPSRWVINFGSMTEQEASAWPRLLQIVRERVKPERDRNNRESYRRNWWHFGEKRPDLMRALVGHSRVLIHSFVSSHLAFAFVPSNYVIAGPTNVFVLSTWAAFAALQNRVHEAWALLNASSLEDRLRYTPTDCFETFPFPVGWQTLPTLEAIGKTYYEHRAAWMVAHDEGLTKLYNRFHDPEETDDGIVQLRTLHAEMDRAMLDAYGWRDLTPTCDFFPVHADDEEDDNASGRKVKMRYRWPDELRDDVLARLLELNQLRAAAESGSSPTSSTQPASTGLTLTAPEPKKRTPRKAK